MRTRSLEEADHGLDIPHEIETKDFKVTGMGHERIKRIFRDWCAERRTYATGQKRSQPSNGSARGFAACSFVLFDTKPRAAVIGF